MGYSFEFPGVRDQETFWKGLIQKRRFYHNDFKEGADRVEAWGSVENLKGFDYNFFGFSYNEACRMDPQHRHLLQHCWWAMEDAGYMNKNQMPVTAVFASASENHYLWNNLADEIQPGNENEALLGNLPDFLATRMAWKLGATGQALTLQSGCSSSLAALHHARVTLLTGQAEMALVGAVSLAAAHQEGYDYLPDGIRSADGEVRAFDHGASGTVFTNGVAALVLKPLRKALEQGDNILGVIEGSALNNDGADKAGFTAPSVSGQTRVIRHAMRIAAAQPEQVALYEAHGTGTQLGDPIEFAAISEVWSGASSTHSTCALQSVKANLGHLDTVSGLAGVIKACLVLKHRQLPPQINFSKPSPHIDLENSPFFVNTETKPLTDEARFACVSALGIGGTNAHVIISAAPDEPAIRATEPEGLFLFSATNHKAIEESQQAWAEWKGGDDAIAKAAQITQQGRTTFRVRQSLWAGSVDELQAGLNKHRKPASVVQDAPAVVLMFTGQGSQYAGMGKHLYQRSASFRDKLDEKFAIFQELSGHDYHDVLFEHQEAIHQLQHIQPGLLALEVALAEYLEHCGIHADLMLGHSLGEYSAMVAAHALNFRDAARLILRRAQLVQETAPGAMCSVMAGIDTLEPLLDGIDLDIAALNTDTLTALSGTAAEIQRFVKRAEQHAIICQTLKVERAFHSRLLDPILPAFSEALAEVSFAEAQTQVISTLTGRGIDLAQYGQPEYWLRQMREPVAFAASIRSAADYADSSCFIEVGPGQTLKALASQTTSHTCVNLLPHRREADNGWKTLFIGLGQIWEQGVDIEWQRVRDQHALPACPPLPKYSFQLTDCWKTPQPRSGGGVLRSYRKCWVPLPENAAATDEVNNEWLLMSDGTVPSTELAQELDVSLAKQGKSSRVVRYSESYAATLENAPANIALLFHPDSAGQEAFSPLLTVLTLVKASGVARRRRVNIITRSGLDVLAEPNAALAALSSAVKSLNQEYPALTTRLIDFDGSDQELLARELDAGSPVIVALRQSDRLGEGFLPVPAGKDADDDGTPGTPRSVLILGGGGQVGLQYARTFLENSQAKVCLLQRSSMETLKSRGDKASRQRAVRIDTLMRDWPERLILREADVESEASLLAACRDAAEVMGSLDTLIHTAGVDASMHYQLIKDVDAGFCRASFAAKSRGLHNMAAVAATLEIPHCHVISSISAPLGGIGMCVYSSLHAWLDAAVAKLRRQHPSRWTVLNWEAWEFGNDDEVPDNFRQGAFGSQLNQYAMQPAQGRRFLWHCWSGLAGQHIISSTDFQQRYQEWVNNSHDYSEPVAEEHARSTPRPEISTEYHPAGNPTEEKIVSVWESLLGMSGIGVDDNFFELGGHSLLALRMTVEVNKAEQSSLSMVDIFQYPTIRKLAFGIVGAKGLEDLDAARKEAEERARKRRQMRRSVAHAATAAVPAETGSPLGPATKSSDHLTNYRHFSKP